MENIESLRTAKGNGKIVRLLSSFLLDQKWLPKGDTETQGDFLVCVYKDTDDRLIPVLSADVDLPIEDRFDNSTLLELKAEPAYVAKNGGNVKKVLLEPIIASVNEVTACEEIASQKFKKVEKNHFWFDTLNDADKKYIELVKELCGKDELPFISQYINCNNIN